MTTTQDTLLTLLRKVLPDADDFERMTDVTFIQDMDYEAFVTHNVTAANILMEYHQEDATFFKGLLRRICFRQIHTLDMESCSIFTATTAYFNDEMEIIIVTPR